MTTVIGTQFSDLTKQEEEFGDSDKCGYVDCGKTPTTHYILCPADNCVSREPVCKEHAQKVFHAKHGGYSHINARFHDCWHSYPLRTLLIFPK